MKGRSHGKKCSHAQSSPESKDVSEEMVSWPYFTSCHWQRQKKLEMVSRFKVDTVHKGPKSYGQSSCLNPVKARSHLAM